MNLPTIKNAFQKIKNACQSRLEEIYPGGIPEDINSRYEEELFFLEHLLPTAKSDLQKKS